MAEKYPAGVYRFRLRDGLVGAQMLFVAFGALVLVFGIGLAGIVGVLLNLVLPRNRSTQA
jgi:xanthine/uracil permease